MRRVGLDLGIRAPHRAAIYDDATPVGRAFRVDRTRGAMDALLAAAQAGADGPCEFVMEPTGLMWLPLAAELSFRGHRVYVPKPHKTKALRKFFAQHAKTDCNDASVAARIRHVDPDGVGCRNSAEPTAQRFRRPPSDGRCRAGSRFSRPLCRSRSGPNLWACPDRRRPVRSTSSSGCSRAGSTATRTR